MKYDTDINIVLIKCVLELSLIGVTMEAHDDEPVYRFCHTTAPLEWAYLYFLFTIEYCQTAYRDSVG